MASFWDTLEQPFFVLAPMEDVTDVAFRRLIASYKAPDVTFTEFTSADGLVLADEAGRQKLERKLHYHESERPIVAQLFSSVPEHMEAAARLAQERGFDGLDINMGCPDRAIEKQGCGAAMIRNPDAARAIIRAAQRGAPDVPISVKTRVGYNSDEEMEEWVRTLLSEDIAALTLHARTRRDMSKVPARWELICRAVELRDKAGVKTLIIGNGDVRDITGARTKVIETGCDGVMLGRAIYGNPWLFMERTNEPTPYERITALMRHLELFDRLLADITSYAVMKKHFKAYIQGWDGAKELRMRLMETGSVAEALTLLRHHVAPEGERV